ncbi:MAG: hypothetical protein LBN09_00470 [Clostridioides sp.]|jgi:hypothetical protein|nr:hypothetical protein [Clostridioides sp.]
MTKLEKDILFFISRVRCITETQVRKLYNSKKIYNRKAVKKALKRMVNEFTLLKIKSDLEFPMFKGENIYFLNGASIYKEEELFKALVGTELLVRLSISGSELMRFYRNVKFADKNYDIYVLYRNRCGDLKQLLCDVYDENAEVSDVDYMKYRGIEEQIKNATIPFFEVPEILVVSSGKVCNSSEKLFDRKSSKVHFIEFGLNKLFSLI